MSKKKKVSKKEDARLLSELARFEMAAHQPGATAESLSRTTRDLDLAQEGTPANPLDSKKVRKAIRQRARTVALNSGAVDTTMMAASLLPDLMEIINWALEEDPGFEGSADNGFGSVFSRIPD